MNKILCEFFTGTIGHVAHGKSTIVKAISGVQTVRFKNELERNITIKLGEYVTTCRILLPLHIVLIVAQHDRNLSSFSKDTLIISCVQQKRH